MSNEARLEAILFFKNEPVSRKELSKLLDISQEEVDAALKKLQEEYIDRGIVIMTDGEYLSLGTHPKASELIEKLQKEELSRELGRAGLETLAIVLYKGPVSRREIDHIRGVNSTHIIRSLMIRGLIERDGDQTASTGEASRAGRSFSYKPTLKLLQYLGVARINDLPEFETAFKKMEEFVESQPKEDNG